MFLFSGEHSDTLERVVKRLFPLKTEVCMSAEWSKMSDMIGEGATQDVQVEPFNSREERDAYFFKWMAEP